MANAATNNPDKTFLGFDFSTQQLKAVVTDYNLQVLHVASVLFDSDFPEYKGPPENMSGGVKKHADGRTVTAPVIMWIKAVDLVLQRLKEKGVDFSKLCALSGTAQQHGSVYWATGAHSALEHLDPNVPLSKHLEQSFSITDSPIWMDSSTSAQCKKLEDAVGGPEALAEITGSKGFQRFTGPQIAKIYETKPEIYARTERISLVSSFACSLFLGAYASIDYADGSGMNLLNIRTKDWDETCLKACAPNVASKLGKPVPSNTNLGKIHAYFVQRWNFSPDCSVVVFTGDNPASLAGLNLHKSDVAISLGTSDTVFTWLFEPVVTDAHVLCNPLQSDAYMALLCFKNGSLTRERVREQCGCRNWDEFNQLLVSTPPGNNGHIGFYFDFPEILPNVAAGDARFNRNDQLTDKFDPSVEARAVIEHQSLAKRAWLEKMQTKLEGARVLVTGGASTNPAILQVLADVFGAKVYTLDVPNSAALGSSYRAKHGILNNASFNELCEHVTNSTLAAEPRREATKIYDQMVARYQKLEQIVLAGQN